MALMAIRLAQNVGAMLPKKLPITLICLSAAARIKPGASMVTMFTLPASMPVAFTKAGQKELAAADVEADRLALELLRLGDVELLEREDADGRARPDAGDRHEVKTTADAARLNGHVEEAEVVLALVDRDAHLGRAEAAVDGDVETAFLPVPELLGGEGEAVGAEREPWQRELDRGRGANDRGSANAECAAG